MYMYIISIYIGQMNAYVHIPVTHTHTHTHIQMDQNLDEAAVAPPENHPYLGLVLGGTSLQLFLIAKRCTLDEVETYYLYL